MLRISLLSWALLVLAVLPAATAEPASTPDGATARNLPVLHPLFADHCVLQRGRTIPIWGWTTPGAPVRVTLADHQAEAVAAADGRWHVNLPALPAGGPHQLSVSGPTTVTIQDILIGEVWLCSGQSNMEQGIVSTRNANAEIAQANHPQLRLCRVGKAMTLSPSVTGNVSWAACTPESVARHGDWGGFSAVAYYFGRTVQEKLHVPVGLIHASWGGTPAQAWVSAAGLAPLHDFDRELKALTAVAAAGGEQDFPARLATWWAASDPGTAAYWQNPAVDDRAWAQMTLPGTWENRGLPDLDGVVWFRREILVPANFANRELILSLTAIDDEDTTWIDGTLIGSNDTWNKHREYRIPAGRVGPGPRILAVRVLDRGGKGGFHGNPADMWLAPTDARDQRIGLAGDWRYRMSVNDGQRLRNAPKRIDDNPHFPTVLSNGMIEPLVGTQLAGVIWYQGESNSGNPVQYRTLLPALIADWRQRFANPTLHVGIVQLANFLPRVNEPVQEGWAGLREAQALTVLADPHASLAVAIDIGEADDIHPTNKYDVGRRLALGALAQHYQQDIPAQGPGFQRLTIEQHSVRLHFNAAEGLKTTDGLAPLGFALAGPDGTWQHAQAAIDGETVVLRAEGISAPRAVRYAWANNPAVNLVNGADLPAIPFRSDGP